MCDVRADSDSTVDGLVQFTSLAQKDKIRAPYTERASVAAYCIIHGSVDSCGP